MYLTRFAIITWLIITHIGYVMIKADQTQISAATPTKLFTKLDAEEILGSPAHITDSVSKKDASTSSYLCGYKTDAKDPKSGKIGAIFFLFEAYNNLDGAHKRYSDVYLSNKSHGAVAINHLGDEALYHTDNQNFDLMMVRKGKYVFNIKVNKRTSTTSLNALRKTVKRITEQI